MKGTEKINLFDPAGIKEWERAAAEELQGGNPWNKLTFSGTDFTIRPYYDRPASPGKPKRLATSVNEFLGARAWHNCPLVRVGKPSEANEEALLHLREGADGVFFELSDTPDFNTLLKNVEWTYCSLNFLATRDQAKTAAALVDYSARKKINLGKVNGAFFGAAQSDQGLSAGFRILGHRAAQKNSPADEIAEAFSNVIKSLGIDFKRQSIAVGLSIDVGTDFFVDAARLRSFRFVWDRILQAKNCAPAPLFIHAWSQPWTDARYEPHSNLLKSTTAAMAGVLGGCDALTIGVEDEKNAMMRRVARNISNILREESHFSLVGDPLSGSYFIDELTNSFCDAAWSKIQRYLA